MNAPATFTPLQVLALAIVDGDLSGLPRVDFPLWESEDWRSAAEYALEGDASELSWMIAREDVFQDFLIWKNADDHREDAEFSSWLIAKARWNRPSRFEAALTYAERKLVGEIGEARVLIGAAA